MRNTSKKYFLTRKHPRVQLSQKLFLGRGRFGIIAARFNEKITDRLLAHCADTLVKKGVPPKNIVITRVPGSFEIPWAAQEAALSKKFDAIICIGAILKGQTPQNNHISRSVFQHLHTISLSTRVPIILGIITPNTYAQGAARTKGNLDRGREAALAALEMAELRRKRPWR